MKTCKCSHDKSDHGKYFRVCTVCPCSNYLKKEYPTKYDKAYLGMLFGMIGFFVFMIISLNYSVSLFEQNVLDESINMSIGEFIALLITIGTFVSLAAILLYASSIVEYFNLKRRKDYNAN